MPSRQESARPDNSKAQRPFSVSVAYFGFTVFLDEGPCPRPPNFCTLKLAASACAALGFMLMVFARRQCGPVGFGPLVSGHVRGQGPARCAQYRRFARHLHAVVRSDLEGSSHTTTRGRNLPWAHLSQPLPRSRGAELAYGAAGALIVLMFWMCCSAQIFCLAPSSPKRSLTSESLAAPPQRGTIQEGVNSS